MPKLIETNAKFYELVQKARRKGRKPGEPPKTYHAIAADCGVSKQCLQYYMRGTWKPRSFRVPTLASGLGCSEKAVRACFGDLQE